MFKKGADMTGKTDTPMYEIKGKAFKEFAKRRKMNEKKFPGGKKRGPLATINPPKRGGKKPVRMPRYDQMPNDYRPRPKKPRP
jgi:hypothetical protein